MYDLFPHLNDKKETEELIISLEKIIQKRPPIDFKKFDMLNAELNELCNSKVSMSDINIKSIAKEI